MPGIRMRGVSRKQERKAWVALQKSRRCEIAVSVDFNAYKLIFHMHTVISAVTETHICVLRAPHVAFSFFKALAATWSQ